MWLATMPCARGLTPVTRLAWVGHVVLGNTHSIPAASAPRSARRRSTGARTAGSRQEKAAKPSMLMTMTRGFMRGSIARFARDFRLEAPSGGTDNHGPRNKRGYQGLRAVVEGITHGSRVPAGLH